MSDMLPIDSMVLNDAVSYWRRVGKPYPIEVSDPSIHIEAAYRLHHAGLVDLRVERKGKHLALRVMPTEAGWRRFQPGIRPVDNHLTPGILSPEPQPDLPPVADTGTVNVWETGRTRLRVVEALGKQPYVEIAYDDVPIVRGFVFPTSDGRMPPPPAEADIQALLFRYFGHFVGPNTREDMAMAIVKAWRTGDWS